MTQRAIPRDIRRVDRLDARRRKRVARLLKTRQAPTLADSVAYAMMLLDEHAKLRERHGETDAETATLAHLYALQKLYVRLD